MENQKLYSDKIINSMKGAQRTAPAPDLYNNIQLRLQSEIVAMPASKMRLRLAAAILILIANSWCFLNYNQHNSENNQTEIYKESTLINHYNLYS